MKALRLCWERYTALVLWLCSLVVIGLVVTP